jgi:hypothetical protein
VQRTDSFFEPRNAGTSRFVRGAGFVVGLAALAFAGRVAVRELAMSESPAGHLARAIDTRLSPERYATHPVSSAISPSPRDPIRTATVHERVIASDLGAESLVGATTAPDGGTNETGPGAVPPPKRPEASSAVRRAPIGPRVAVVFDDLGYSVTGLAQELLEMAPPLTFAVLANLPNSAAFAESARARGHEVLLHVPMEPLDPLSHNPGPGALLVDLETEENLNRLHAQLDAFDGYVGISNHMGSRFATERRHVGPMLREIRRLRPECFFLDSRTTPYSILALEARQIGMPCVENDAFLDGDPENPNAPALRLAAVARQRGSAVGIGHVRRETIDGFRAVRENWERDGVRLVALSELVTRDSLP